MIDAREREIRNRLARTCTMQLGECQLIEHGPIALAIKSREELAGLIRAPALGRVRDEYEPLRDGGRVVIGPTGVGKTSFAMYVARRLTEAQLEREESAGDDFSAKFSARRRAIKVKCIGAAHLPQAVLQTGLGSGEAPLVTEAVEADVLILDDLGWESRRAGAADIVVEVLARRYDGGRVTIVTSGKRLDELTNTYGEAVIRRICEAGGKPGKVIDCWAEAKR